MVYYITTICISRHTRILIINQCCLSELMYFRFNVMIEWLMVVSPRECGVLWVWTRFADVRHKNDDLPQLWVGLIPTICGMRPKDRIECLWKFYCDIFTQDNFKRKVLVKVKVWFKACYFLAIWLFHFRLVLKLFRSIMPML